jgi:hypothetical protein
MHPIFCSAFTLASNQLLCLYKILERDVPEGVAEGQLNLQHLMSVEIQCCEQQKFRYTTTTFKSITVQIAIKIIGNFLKQICFPNRILVSRASVLSTAYRTPHTEKYM